MPFTLTMPKLSPTMETGTIAKWHKKVGEFVEAGELLIEVSTDKATVEHNAIDEGWLKKILIQEGDEAAVNQGIAIFTEEENESIDGYRPEGEEPPKAEEPDSEAGDEDEEEAPKAPAKAEVRRQEPSFAPAPPLTGAHLHLARGDIAERVRASPLAKKLAEQEGLDLTTIDGSGPRGRIMARDLDRAQPKSDVTFSRRELPKKDPGSYIEEPISHIRKIIGQRLQQSKSYIPHFYVRSHVNASPLVELREQLKDSGLKLTFNDFVVRATALALRKFPEVNSGYYAAKEAILRFETIDISIAVDIRDGLITPILRHADFKNLGEISLEVKSLAKRARDGKLALEEFQGGSFTISNLGMFGIDDFVAVINPPQAAILAVGGIQEVPVVKDGAVVPGRRMALTLSVDHRVIDGAVAAKFIQTVVKYLESPSLLLI